jgi:hypothetical protein
MADDQNASLSDVRQWEIYYVDWLHEDGTSKERTALCVSTPEEIAAQGLARFVKITGQDHPEVPCRMKIDEKDAYFRHTGLSKTSWIHYAEEQNIPQEKLRNRKGQIGPFTVAFLKAWLKGQTP